MRPGREGPRSSGPSIVAPGRVRTPGVLIAGRAPADAEGRESNRGFGTSPKEWTSPTTASGWMADRPPNHVAGSPEPAPDHHAEPKPKPTGTLETLQETSP